MKNLESIKTSGTHPLVTMLVFGAVFATLVGSGSYVSKHRATARILEADSTEFITFFDQR